MPKGIPAPWIYPSESEIARDLKRLFEEQDSKLADVEFVCVGNATVYAHSLIIGAACPALQQLMDGSKKPSTPFESVTNDGKMIRIVCSDAVSMTILKRVLVFLYSGDCVIANKNDQVKIGGFLN